MGGRRFAVADALSVVVGSVRIIAAHWPVLLTIYLLGQAVRNGALWAAVVTTKVNHTLGAFLVPIAPLATLTALILMLRVVSPSLPFATFDAAATAPAANAPAANATAAGASAPTTMVARQTRVVRERLALLASTLIPFLAVYTAQGYLKEDQTKFVTEANADEFMNNADFWLGRGVLDGSRTVIASGYWFWVLVGLALALRWLVDRLDLPERSTGWGLFAAYVEVAWVTLLATGFTNQVREWQGWIERRQFVATVYDWWVGLTDLLGPVASPVRGAVSWVWGSLGGFDDIIVVPMAWLTVGAVVYGRSITAPSVRAGVDPRAQAWRQRMARVPKPVRKAGGEFIAGWWSRFKGLAGGVRTLASAGLTPMLLFCLVFVLATGAETLTALGLQRLIGPGNVNDLIAFTPYRDLLARAVYTVLVVGLLAAAVDRIVGRTAPSDPTAPSEPGDPVAEPPLTDAGPTPR